MPFPRWVASLLAILLASCSDAAVPTIPPPTEVEPAQNTVTRISLCCGGVFYAGSTTSMFAQAFDANNNVVYGAQLSWSSSNASVASVSGGGSPATVVFGSPGNAVITVSSGGVFAHEAVQVIPLPVVTTVTITPSPVELALGGTQQLTATAYDQFGNPMTGGTRTWTSADPTIATVSSTGVVTGAGPGITSVQVTIDGVSATVPITVNKLKVTLNGPNYTMMEGLYSWSAAASGGTGSYSYSWSVEWPYTAPGNIIPLGSAVSQSLWIDSSSDSYFIVYLTVTSGNQSASAAVGVCNLIVGMSC